MLNPKSCVESEGPKDISTCRTCCWAMLSKVRLSGEGRWKGGAVGHSVYVVSASAAPCAANLTQGMVSLPQRTLGSFTIVDQFEGCEARFRFRWPAWRRNSSSFVRGESPCLLQWQWQWKWQWHWPRHGHCRSELETRNGGFTGSCKVNIGTRVTGLVCFPCASRPW